MVTVGKKLVIKIGSSTLTTSESKIDYDYLENIVEQIANVKQAGWQPVIVTSAAIACGLEALRIPKRPADIPSLQAAASVGQSALSAAYANAFSKYDITSSLVLLTRRDTANRETYLHARDTFLKLLEFGVVPVVNENDTVSIEQIRFGDNDTLAALVACLIDADLVVMLSDIDGLFDKNPHTNADAQLIPHVDRITQELMGLAGGSTTTVGSGGMITKMRAARVLMVAGIEMMVCNGRTQNIIVDAVSGDAVGTRFSAATKPHVITPKKLWIALGDSVRGALIVDDGAKKALISQGRSLLCVGIRMVEGDFVNDDIIDIKDSQGNVFARGRTAASSDELSLACGLSQEALKANRILKGLANKSVVHRDDLVVFE